MSFILGLLMGLSLFLWWGGQLEARRQEVLHDWRSNSRSRFWGSQWLLRLLGSLGAQKGRHRGPITDRQQSFDDLEKPIDNLQQILQLAPIGYLQVDDQNQLFWCNQQAAQLLEFSAPGPTKPRLLLEVVRSYELDHLISITREGQKPCQLEWTFYPTYSGAGEVKGDRLPFTLRGYGLPLPNGQVGVYLENRQEVVLLSGQRDRAFSDVAHELKTPLTSIRLVAETLQSRLDLPLRNWVDRLLSEAIRLSDLVEILLDLGRLEKGSHYSLNLKTINLPELIQSAWLSLEPLAGKKQLQLDYTGPERILIQADEHRLYRVLINLLDNSIKYNRTGGYIQVKLSQTLKQIHLEVIDSGTGFKESELPYVFERFYRGDPSRARTEATGNGADRGAGPGLPPTHGSGLGLAIVRQIIEAHQGYVRASNHPETGGAWLEVFLPWQQLDRPGVEEN